MLAVAAAALTAPPATARAGERGLRLLGLVALQDPPRESAVRSIRRCGDAGITALMITGDHPATARAVAAELGILRPGDEVVLGRDLVAGRPPDARTRVYARTAPEQKLAIVEAWQSAGHVVAMTGDGVNDAPALRRADVGVAMGRSGTEVARQSAAVILADDDIGTIVAAVGEGRRVYDNIRRFLLYGLAGGTAELIVMLLGPVADGLAVPLLPTQILWMNLLTHGLPGVAMGAEPAEPDIMSRPPRDPRQGCWAAGCGRASGPRRAPRAVALAPACGPARRSASGR